MSLLMPTSVHHTTYLLHCRHKTEQAHHELLIHVCLVWHASLHRQKTMFRLVITAAAFLTAAVGEPRYKQVGKRIVGFAPDKTCNGYGVLNVYASTWTGPCCSPLVNLSPDGAVLVMTKYNQMYSGLDQTTSVFRYGGTQYEPVQSTPFPPGGGATSVSTNGTFVAMESISHAASGGGLTSAAGGVFHYDAHYGYYHQVDVYDDYHDGQKILDGGVLSADGTLLVTTTKWSSLAVTTPDTQWTGVQVYQPEELGIFEYRDFAYHRNGMPSWTIEPRCLNAFLPWRLSADGIFLNIGTCVFKQGRPIPVPSIWIGCTGTCIATSTALSSDGLVLAIGNYGDDGNRGAAWVFRYDNEAGEYIQVGGKLVGTGEGQPPYQGMSVSLSSDGSILAVGGPNYGTSSSTSVGGVWLYRYDGNAYQQLGDRISTSDNYGSSRQGSAVSLSSDGTLLAIGGVSPDTNQMLAWVFRSEPDPRYDEAVFLGSLCIILTKYPCNEWQP